MSAQVCPLWDFSLALYRDEVPAALLGLQERHGLSASLILFCLHHPLTAPPGQDLAALEAAIAASAVWHDTVVRPIRSARRAAKALLAAAEMPRDPAAREAHYRAILRTELECERIEQLLISNAAATSAPTTPSGEGSPARAAAMIDACLGRHDVIPDAEDRAAIARLLAAAYPKDPTRQET